MSSWTSSTSFARRGGNLSFQNGTLTVEFDRTKYSKILNHKLGQIVFSSTDVNKYRQEAIQASPSLFYVRSVYQDQRIVEPNSNGSITILAHGRPSQKRLTENCAAVRMTCSSGSGSNTACTRGKCIAGRLQRVVETRSDGTERISPYKWRFFSNYDSYYVLQEKGVILLRNNKRGTSRYTKVYVPPNTYLTDEDFVRKLFKNFSYLILIGGEDSKDRFIAEGVKQSSYYNPNKIPVEDFIYQDIESLGEPWYGLASSEIELSRGQNEDDRKFLSNVYDRLSSLFSKAIQITPSSLSQARVSYYTSELSRPVYSRLPGTSGAYSSIDNEDTVSKWAVSGADELLTQSKAKIANFYRDYLDPDTCYPLTLDWLAQHVGLFGALWDVKWPVEVKRTLVKNAFGWWDRDVDGVNHKSKILQEFPFSTSPLWGDQEAEHFVDYGEIEKFNISPLSKEISLVGKYKTYSPGQESLGGEYMLFGDYTNNPQFMSSDWNGMIESKGGMLTIAFLVSVFGLKSHVPQELEVIDLNKGHFKPKSGLRSLEVDAPPLLPFKADMCQCGDEMDLKVGNYNNQMVVGFSRIYEPEETKNLIFRVPYYYNRNGRSWSKVEYIAKNWTPAHLNARVQYPYLSADLWAVGDAFFEPDYEVS